MKIKIDTKEDSTEDIRKVVAMLSHLIDQQKTTSRNVFEDPNPEVPTTSETSQQNIFGNIFGDSPSTSTEENSEEPKEETPKDVYIKTY